MSQILKPPQRRPDLIGQCESCKTIAIFGEEEQWINEKVVRVPAQIKERFYGDKPDVVIPAYERTDRIVSAWCQASEWCKEREQIVPLHELDSITGMWLKDTGEGNPDANENHRQRMAKYMSDSIADAFAGWSTRAAPVEDPKPTGIVARICDAWGWFWRKE